MAIVLTLPDEFEIENYTGLQSFLTEHLQLDQDTVDQLPNLIRLAELRLKRQVLSPLRETSETLATVAATQTVALPSGFKQARQLRLIGDQSTGYPLDPVTLNTIESYDYAGKPVAWAISGTSILLGPVPDAVYTLKLIYEAGLAALSDNTQTNWLLSSHADAYVYMASACVGLHLGDQAMAAGYNALAEAVIAEVNAEGVRYRKAAPMRLRSPVVV